MSPRYRLLGRIAGYTLIFVSTTIFFIGFVAPYWMKLQTGQHGGMWGSSYQFSMGEIPKLIWQFFECFTLAILLTACIICLITDLCGQKLRICSSATLAGVGGLLGFLVSLMFIAFTVREFKFGNISYSWAFYMATFGSVCAIVASIVTACSNATPDPTPQVLSTPETGLVVTTNPAGGILVTSPYVTQGSLPLVTDPSSQNSHLQTVQYPSVMV